jgi:hypothetical protein
MDEAAGIVWSDASPSSVIKLEPHSFTFAAQGESLVIFKPDGTFEFPKGETREAAKAFWSYVEEYMRESYGKHARAALNPSSSPSIEAPEPRI